MIKKIATITLKDEVNCIISGLRIPDMEELYEKYGTYTANYFFDPKYKMKKWDGKIRFFKKTGKTYIQLLPEIFKDLKKYGYKIDLKDNRKPITIKSKPIDKNYFKQYGWVLGEHQVNAVNAVINNENNGIIRIGTSGGKTLITAVLSHIYNELGFKILIIVPSKDLVEQTKNEINEFPIDVGTYWSKNKQTENKTIVSTWQSLKNNKHLLTMFNGILVDECHGSRGAVLNELLSDKGADCPIRIGLTGTLPDHVSEKMTVLTNIGPIVASIKSKKLIEQGWSSSLNLNMLEFKEDFTEEWEKFKKKNPELANTTPYNLFKLSYFPDYTAEKNYLIRNHERLDIIAKFINKTTEKYGNSFVLVNTVKFGKQLAKMLNNGIYVSSTINNRKEIYDKFDDNFDLNAVATFGLASTGLNIPRIFNLFYIDGGKASIRIVQTIGRGLRKSYDKDNVNVFDIYSDIKFSKRHSSKRKKIYKKEGHEFSQHKYEYNKSDINKIFNKCFKNNKKKIEKEVFE